MAEMPKETRSTRQEARRQRRLEELTTLFNLASGGYGSSFQNKEVSDRAIRAIESLVLDTPFGGS